MSNGKTGLKGKNWISELANKRVVWLSHTFQNGGRGLTFEEVRKKVMKELPGGQTINDKLIRKVAFGVENGKNPKTWDDAWGILLPAGTGTKRWEEEREERRIRFVNQQKSRDAYSERQKQKAVRQFPSNKEEDAQVETSLDGIQQALNDVPSEVREVVEQLKMVMGKHRFRKLELDLQANGKAALALEPVPHTVYTTL